MTKWFGFPIQILHAYFLLTTAWGLLAKTVKKHFINSYFLVSILLLGSVFTNLYWGVKTKQWQLFSTITYTTTYLFLIFELGIVLMGLIARRIPEASRKKGLSLFFLLYGIGFLVYILGGGILLSPGRFFYTGVYYALHFPPAEKPADAPSYQGF